MHISIYQPAWDNISLVFLNYIHVTFRIHQYLCSSVKP